MEGAAALPGDAKSERSRPRRKLRLAQDSLEVAIGG